MEEQLQAKLVEILSSIQNAAKVSGDFALEQLPDIAQQYVLYGRVVLNFYVLLSLLTVFVGIGIGFLTYKHIKQYDELEEANPFYTIFGGIGCLIFTLVGLVETVQHLSSLVMVWAAPKVWLLVELGKLWK